MTAMRKGRRRPRPKARKLDASAAREVLKDLRGWSFLGLVVDEDDDGHFEITAGQDGEDVMIEVELQPSGLPVFCRLGAGCGGAGSGDWKIPPLGSEVAVIIPGGEPECGGIIVSVLSSGDVPDEVADGKRVIANADGDIILRSMGLIRLGSATASESVIKGDAYRGHEDTYVDALKLYADAMNTAIGQTLLTVPQKAAFTAATTAFKLAADLFKTAAATDLSSKVKID